MPIGKIVRVDITLNTQGVAQTGFGVGLILGQTAGRITDGNVHYYANIDEVGEDFETTDPEYLAAVKYFLPDVKPEQLAIAYALPVDAAQTVEVETVAEADYVLTVNGHVVTFTNTHSAWTPNDVAGALAAAIESAVAEVTATPESTPSGVIHLTCEGAMTVTTSDAKLTLGTATAYKGIDAILSELVETQNGNAWYALNLVGASSVDILQAAAWVETHNKIHGVDISASDAKTSGGNAVANAIYAAKYDRTFVFYNSTAASYQSMAAFGLLLPKTTGKWIFALKTLKGITVDTLTSTEVGYLEAKNINYYKADGGRDLTQLGKMGSGEWIDNIVGIDWIQARMEEGTFAVLVNNDKVPYTNDGITMIANPVRSTLQEAKDTNNIIDEFTVTQVDADNISANQKGTRQLKAITFTGTLAGAIQEIRIEGTVSY
jgi:hypothetical protein